MAERRRNRGFTLLEVLVALAVVAIAMSAVIGSVAAHTDNVAYLRDRTLAQWVALNRITELRLGGAWPGEGTERGTSLLANQEWHWAVAVKNTPDADVRRLDVSVSLSRDGQPLASVAGYLARPL